jgi:rhamnogalacturonan endolyase
MLLLVLATATAVVSRGAGFSAPGLKAAPPVTVAEDDSFFTLANGLLIARIARNSGVLVSLKYEGLELMAQGRGGAEGGYWSSVGRGQRGPRHSPVIRINPGTNGGARAEISCRLYNEPKSPEAAFDADYRYALGRGEHWLYVYAVFEHHAGFSPVDLGEARYCLKLNPEVFDYLTVDADRRRVMPSGYDWDHGAPLNLKEARRMTSGIHKGEPEHKYDYSAVFSATPAYGWSSTRDGVGLWMINPSLEYIGGGPTKAELTGHLDNNPGGSPTLLNMWLGSHYGGTTVAVAGDEEWTKVVGPFLLYCNSRGTKQRGGSAGETPALPREHELLWKDALSRAASEGKLWPYAWISDPNYPVEAARGQVSGQLIISDPLAPGLRVSNVWVGLTAPDYVAPRSGFGGRFGSRRTVATNTTAAAVSTNVPFQPALFGRGGFPPLVDWQRDAKFYQFWTRADGRGRFTIPHVRPGKYTLHAIADGVLGEFTLTNLSVAAGQPCPLGKLAWTPSRFGRTVWEIGVPDRTAREFFHGDHYWQWGLYFDYPKEFPNDVNFVIGKSDWHRDWNYVQPPRIIAQNVPTTGEEDEETESAPPPPRFGSGGIRPTTWAVTFSMPKPVQGKATLRLAFCGTHAGCNVEAFLNGISIGETGTLPSTSAMQRDGIRAYWVERDLGFDAQLLGQGTNTFKLLSHANSWSQGVMYDYLRLEVVETK